MAGEKKTGCGVSALIAAAGMGTRMGAGVNKQFLLLEGVPILAYTLRAFDASDLVEEIIVVSREDEILTVSDLVKEFGIRKVKGIVPGGRTRQESVRLGLAHITGDRVLVHDGARPFVAPEQINAVAKALKNCPAAALGIPVRDTVKRVDAMGRIVETLEREGLYRIQTPQGFHTEQLKKLHEEAEKQGISVTDDCALAEDRGIPVTIVEGSAVNLKVTTPEDLQIGRVLLRLGDLENQTN